MKKSLIILMAAIMAAFNASAALTADWKIHMPFDAWPTQVIDTPGRVYFLSRTFENKAELPERSISSNSLFYYDKEGDEVVSVNERNQANGNAVACIGYNAVKKYLLVVYSDCDIDFIYDDGRVFNLQALKVTSIPGKKEVNNITFDRNNNMAYLATSFGYVALNDTKHEIAESRNYGENVEAIARCGSNVVMIVDKKVYYAPAAEQRFNINDYVMVEDAPEVGAIIPLKSGNFYAYKTSHSTYMGAFRKNIDGAYEWEKMLDDTQMLGLQQLPDGYRLTGNVVIYKINYDDGSITRQVRPQEEYAHHTATYDGNTAWTLTERKGLRSYKINGDANWTLTRDYIRPNAPATYISSHAAYHPTYGMLAGSNGVDRAYNEFNQNTPANLSALKGGFWKEFGPLYTVPDKLASATNYSGVAVDPANPNYVYRASVLNGLMRINLANPNDIMIFGNSRNPNAGKEGFVEVAGKLAAWDRLCRFSTPQFTSDGTMWMLYNNADKERNELWWWTASDRAATTSAATYRKMNSMTLPAEFVSNNTDVMITLSKNPNMIVVGGLANGGMLMFYDHNGTPGVTTDDKYVVMTRPNDQDGGGVNFLDINYLAEDPATGLVWIMSQRGLFTVNPATVFDHPNTVNRIKVARNDGTNLADYLLNEINVNHMGIDGENRKWFSTSNGIVCTSQDGRSILGEFTTDNSYLPADNVYYACYNPENNSLLLGTDGGLVEMFPSGSGGGSLADDNGMRIYPNPVEPDYYGWVRIDNITDGSLVKITDSKGGIVKELGPVQGGSVEWDVSGLNNRRVTTGVYYVMVSPGSAGNGNTQISKILILN